MSVRNFNKLIRILQLSWNEVRNFRRHMARSSWVQNPIGQLRTISIIFVFVYVIIRHSCHICVYFKVIVIFAVVFCTIAFFLRFVRLASFLTVFRWFGTFCDKMSFGSASKAFPSCTIWIFVWGSTSRTSFLFLFSDHFNTFFHRMVRKSTICALCLGRVWFIIVFTRSWLNAVNIQILFL